MDKILQFWMMYMLSPKSFNMFTKCINSTNTFFDATNVYAIPQILLGTLRPKGSLNTF